MSQRVSPVRGWKLPAAALAAALWTTAAVAQTERQLDAHEHGAGTLNISIEGTNVQMELEVPGSDIVGFEHAARTKAQRKAVADARKVLANPLEIFQVPAAAGCKVAAAKVKLEGGDSNGHAHGHKHTHGKNETKGKTDAAAEPAHSEFHVAATLNCTNVARMTEITFAYFARFKKAQKLTVNIVSATGQTSAVVDRSKAKLALGGS